MNTEMERERAFVRMKILDACVEGNVRGSGKASVLNGKGYGIMADILPLKPSKVCGEGFGTLSFKKLAKFAEEHGVPFGTPADVIAEYMREPEPAGAEDPAAGGADEPLAEPDPAFFAKTLGQLGLGTNACHFLYRYNVHDGADLVKLRGMPGSKHRGQGSKQEIRLMMKRERVRFRMTHAEIAAIMAGVADAAVQPALPTRRPRHPRETAQIVADLAAAAGEPELRLADAIRATPLTDAAAATKANAAIAAERKDVVTALATSFLSAGKLTEPADRENQRAAAYVLLERALKGDLTGLAGEDVVTLYQSVCLSYTLEEVQSEGAKVSRLAHRLWSIAESNESKKPA